MNTSHRGPRSLKRGVSLAAIGALTLALIPAGTAAGQTPAPARGSDNVCVDVPDAGFNDVTAANIHRNNINCIVDYAIARGTSDTSFAPARNVLRADMASFIAQFVEAATGETLPTPGTFPFNDVPAANVHRTNIHKLASANIVRGTGGNAYSPNRTINRDAMASFVRQAIDYVDDQNADNQTQPPSQATSDFTDIGGNVHAANIRALRGQRIVAGTSVGRYSPDNPVRRDAMTTFIMQGADYLDEIDLFAPTRTEEEPDLEDNEFLVDLSWINEVDDTGAEPEFFQGEEDAEGVAFLSIEDDGVEFAVEYGDVTPPFAAAPGFHIHEGGIDENGPVILTLATGAELDAGDGELEGAAGEADFAEDDFDGTFEEFLQDLVDNPEDYYLNLHSDAFPEGAIRGQLPDGGQDLVPDPDDDEDEDGEEGESEAGQEFGAGVPELIRVETSRNNETRELTVRWVFSEALQTNVESANFTITDPTTTPIPATAPDTSTEATRLTGADTNVVRAIYRDTATSTFDYDDVDQYTVATVNRGPLTGPYAAVSVADGTPAPTRSLSLGSASFPAGYALNRITPNLVSVGNFQNAGPLSVNVDFTFDKDLTPGTVAGSDYEIVLATPRDVAPGTVTGTTAQIFGSNPRVVRVSFLRATIQPQLGGGLADATGFQAAARRGAVNDTDPIGGDVADVAQVVPIGSGSTEGPDLTGVTLTGGADDSLVTFTFDGPGTDLEATDESDFRLTHLDGTESVGQDIVQASGNTVQVEFEPGLVNQSVISAHVVAEAVTRGGLENNIDSVRFARTIPGGTTLGPNLTTVSVAALGTQEFSVTYRFDRPVDFVDPAAGTFALYTSVYGPNDQGYEIVTASDCMIGQDSVSVTCAFDGVVGTPRIAGLAFDSVETETDVTGVGPISNVSQTRAF